MGLSISWIVLLLTGAWIMFIRAKMVAAQHALLLALRLILTVNRAAQYIVDGGSRFGLEL